MRKNKTRHSQVNDVKILLVVVLKLRHGDDNFVYLLSIDIQLIVYHIIFLLLLCKPPIK